VSTFTVINYGYQPDFHRYNVMDTRNEWQRRGYKLRNTYEMNICVLYNGKYKRHVDN